MDIHKYIELHTKIETDQSTSSVEWTAVSRNENLNLSHNKNWPYHLEIERGFYDPSNMSNLDAEEVNVFWYSGYIDWCTYLNLTDYIFQYQSDEDTGNNWNFRFAEIRSNVREIGLGYNAICGFEKRYRESQQRIIVDETASESDSAYFTASSLTNDSYSTALEDYQPHWRRSSVDIKSDISVISSVDKNRYKKNALITGLLQSAESDLSDNGMVFHDSSKDQLNITDTSNNIQNEVQNNIDMKWNAGGEETYQDRVLRLFQSKEDDDVYVHPLREAIKEDVEWQEYRLLRKGVEYTETARQYYLNLPDEQFGIFEKVESKKKPKRKVRKNRYLF